MTRNRISKEMIDKKFVGEVDGLSQQLADNVNESIKFDSQADFVQIARERTGYKGMRVKKIESPYTALSVFLYNDEEHVTYEWRKNTNDDFWMFHTGFVGGISTLPVSLVNMTSKTGTWSTPDGSNNSYTTEVGASFTITAEGEQIEINHVSDPRGGYFEAIVNGDEQNPVHYSTYSSTFKADSTIVAKGLNPESTHTVLIRFLGDDPQHTPSTGVGTARGWAKDGYTGDNRTRFTAIGGYMHNGSYSSNDQLLGYASNKEFAVNLTVQTEKHWFPEHNNVGTAFEISPLKLIVDGKTIGLDDLQTEIPVECSNIQIVQRLACRFPNVTGDIAELKMNQIVNRDGVVSVSGEFKYLQNAYVESGYSMMLPLVQNKVNEVVTAIGGTKVSAGDESGYTFYDEKDRVYSFCGVDARNPSYIAAVTFEYPYKTLRFGEPNRGRDGDAMMFYHQRSGYPKLYAYVYNKHNAVAGEVYRFNGKYIIGKIDGIYQYVK